MSRRQQIVIEAKNSEFWKEVFLPEFQSLHDSLEASAYSTVDLHIRYGLIEAVKALRSLKIRIEDIGSGYVDGQDEPSPLPREI